MPNDVIITPSTGRVQFVKDTGQALLRYNIDLSPATGLIIDSPLTSSVGIKSPNLADLSGNNTFAGATTFNGATTINGNLSVYGATNIFSASNIYITSSVLTVTDNILTLNALSPYQRYAGIEMYDTGSGTLSSILWDGTNDYFFLSGSSVNGKILTGPDNQADLTSNYVPKATAGYKLGNSLIYDNGTNVGIGITTPVYKTEIYSGVKTSAFTGLSISNFNNYDGTANSLVKSQLRFAILESPITTYDASQRTFAILESGNEANNSSSDGFFAISTRLNGAVAEKFRITSAGNVGIGTTSPAQSLDVSGSIRIRSAGTYSDPTDNAGFLNYDSIGGIFTISARSNSGNTFMTFRTSNGGSASERMRIDNNGNVGIGTTSPSTKLNVVGNADIGDSTADTGIIVRHGAGSAQYGRIRFYSTSTNIHTIHSFPTAWNSGTFLNSSAGAMNLQGTNGITFGSWNNIDVAFAQGGNNYFKNLVGIGTTSPTASLHVNSTTAGATLIRADGTNGTLFSVVDDLSDSLMSVNNSAGLPVLEVFADDRIVAGQYGQDDLVVRNNYVGIGTNNPTAKLYVTSSTSIASALFLGGNVGIGTTNPVGKLDVRAGSGGEIVFGTYDANYVVKIQSGDQLNFYNGASPNPGYINYGGGATVLSQNLHVEKATAGVNGLVRIKADGNVGIGTTLPFAKLHVQGNISASSFTSSISNAVGFLGTASWASNAVNATSATSATSASYALTATTATTANNVNNGQLSFASGSGITISAGTFTANQSGNTAFTISLSSNSVTVGSTAISLGGTATTIAGLTSVTSTNFVGALTGTATTASYANALNPANNYTVNSLTEGGYLAYPLREYTINFSAQSTASFYPIAIDSPPGTDGTWHHSFSIDEVNQGGAAAYNVHSMYGEVRGQGWTDQPYFHRVFHNFYDSAERSLLGVWRPTTNWYGVVVYVRGGKNYYVRTTSRSVNGYSSAINIGGTVTYAIKNAAGADVSGTSANIAEMLNLINNPSGFYHSDNAYIGTNQAIHLGTTSAPNLSIGGNAATVTTNANLTGDVTSSGNATTIANNAVTTVKIADANVTYAKIQNLTTSRVLGRISAGAGVVQELAGNDIATIIGSNTVTSASYALLSSTVTTNANLTGDVTSTGNATTIANNAVTTVKIADANVTNAKLANSSLTIGSTAISLGGTATTIAGLTSLNTTNLTASNIYASGTVGIGSTTPTSKLDIGAANLGTTGSNSSEFLKLSTSTSNLDLLYINNTRVSTGVDWQTAGYRIQQKVDSTWMGFIQFNGNNNGGIAFGTGTNTAAATNISTRMTIDGSGNVSILSGSFRTAAGYLTLFNDYIYVSPTNANTLNTAYNVNDVADMWINFRGYQDGQTQFRNFNVGDGRGGNIAWFDGANKRLSINNGQVAEYTLQVMGTGYFSGILRVNSNLTVAGGGDVIIYDSDGTGFFASFMDNGIGYIRIDDTGSGDGKLNINNGLVYIQGAGNNVGIGTTVPGQKLDVEGRIRTRGATGAGGFEIGAATTGTAKWRIEWDSASDSLDFNWVG